MQYSDYSWMIYGAYGYTGKLLVEHAVKSGLRPLIAGRNEYKLKELASKYKLQYSVLFISFGVFGKLVRLFRQTVC